MKGLRGISPVVATALLVLIAVAVSVLLYTWVSGTVSNQPTSQPGLEERLVIDAISYNSTTKSLIVYIRNIGNAPATISAVYVINATSGAVIKEATFNNITVNPGNISELNISSVSLNSGDTVVVKVVTQEGVAATAIYTVRS